MVLAEPCPLSIFWKISWLVGWPVLLLWWCIREGSFRCSLNLSPKILEVSPNVFIIAGKFTALQPIYGPTSVDHWAFVFGVDQQVFDGVITFEVGLHTMPTTDLLNAFTETLGVWYYNMTLSVNFIANGLGTCSTLAVSYIINLSGWPGKPFLHLVQSPIWDIYNE